MGLWTIGQTKGKGWVGGVNRITWEGKVVTMWRSSSVYRPNSELSSYSYQQFHFLNCFFLFVVLSICGSKTLKNTAVLNLMFSFGISMMHVHSVPVCLYFT